MPVVHLRVGMILDDGASNASPAVKMVFEGLPGLDFDDDIAAALASKHHSPGCHAVKKEAKLALQVKLKAGKVQKATAKAKKAAAKVQATLARKAKVAPKVKVGAKKVETEHTEATYRKYEFALAHNVSKQIR
jgi:ribosomal protein L31E